MAWIETLTVLAPLLGLSSVGTMFFGWLFGRKQSKAETAKTLAEAKLTDANAERVKLESNIEALVTNAVSDLVERVNGNSHKIAQVAEAVALVKHEVLPNTGTSLNDAVRRTEAAVERLQGAVEVLNAKQDVSAEDRKSLHTLIESESLRQRERELDARREHDEFRDQIRQLKDCSQN